MKHIDTLSRTTKETITSSECSNEGKTTKGAQWKKPTTRNLAEYLVPTKDPLPKINKRTTPNEPKKQVKNQEKKKEKATHLKKKLENFRASNGPLERTTNKLLPLEEELDKAVLLLIKTLKKFQDRVWKKSQEKARAHRRLVFGLHETLKRIRAEDVKIVVTARNIDKEMEQETVTSLLLDLKKECVKRRLPLINSATKLELSKACSKFPYTNVIAILDTSGAEHYLSEVTRLNEQATFQKELSEHQSSLFA
ncbi:unnamed protein product, partial [Mesorhabditis belari]|uniref:Ribosomal protein eL8/eL30/eS12/Gadd45 domain-containing protein n=1 Tax=Mesorhabditis belari TaxID=2138241 RepID=A0AAF3FF04_9BILA